MDSRRTFGWVFLVAACGVGACSTGPHSGGAMPCGAPGLPAAVGLSPSAGAYFNDGRDGDIRALGTVLQSFRGTEIYLTPSNYTPPDGPTPTGRRAPSTTWQRSTLAPHSCRLAVGETEALPLERTDVSVSIEGFRARVEIDWVFENDRDKRLEGTFDVRLPEGASPHSVAFGALKAETPAVPAVPATAAAAASIADVREQRATTWEKPKEGKMVPREKAAFAYADTVRKKVDPALLEWSGAGVFSVHVFPLEAKKRHRISIAYDVDLVPAGRDLVYRLDLPERAGALDVRLEVAGPGAEVVPAAPVEGGTWHWRQPTGRTFGARLRDHATVLLEGLDPAVGPLFAAQVRPELPPAPARVAERALFLVDASRSAFPDAFPVWLALLSQILERNRGTLREFAVAFWNVETLWWRSGFQENTPENAVDVLEYAQELALEGATDLGQALAATGSLDGDYDLFLLSDGSATWGEDDPNALSRLLDGRHAVFAYRTGAGGTDTATLAHLARESGGAVFSVATERDAAAAATAHTTPPWRIVGVSWAGASDLLLAGRPSALYPGQVVRAVGRGRPDAGAPLRLTLERDGETRVVETYVAPAVHSRLAARCYGEVAVGQLEEVEASGEAAVAYATHFRVVGKTCSLLMLETEADYERYGIRPEEQAKVVGSHPAASAVAATLAERGATLGDPKRRFLDWLDRLAAAPELGMELPDSVRAALRALPVEAFAVAPAALTCRSHAARDLPAAYRRALAARPLSYDAIAAEGDRRRAVLGPSDALRALSSLVEDAPGDLSLARDVASTAMEWGLYPPAFRVLARVLEKRPFEVPTWHSTALALEGMGKADLALAFYETGLALAAGSQSYGDVLQVLSLDYLRLLDRIQRGEVPSAAKGFAVSRRDAVARKAGPTTADLVIVMSWNTDRTDVDLHVTDPNAEEAYYGHRETKIGGRLSRDVTTGYGPEVFVLEKAIPGGYVAKVNYFSSDAVRTSTRSKVYVTTYEDYGRPSERVARKTVVLRDAKEDRPIATLQRKAD